MMSDWLVNSASGTNCTLVRSSCAGNETSLVPLRNVSYSMSNWLSEASDHWIVRGFAPLALQETITLVNSFATVAFGTTDAETGSRSEKDEQNQNFMGDQKGH